MLNLIKIPSHIQLKSHEIRTKSHEIRTKSHEIPIQPAGTWNLPAARRGRGSGYPSPAHGIHGMPLRSVGFVVGYPLVIQHSELENPIYKWNYCSSQRESLLPSLQCVLHRNGQAE